MNSRCVAFADVQANLESLADFSTAVTPLYLSFRLDQENL